MNLTKNEKSMKLVGIHEKRFVRTHLTFKRASPHRDYVRILKLCKEPKSIREIYPSCSGTGVPMGDEVVALARQGYLQKYTLDKYLCNHHKVWYKTSPKGWQLLIAIDLSDF